MPPDVEHPPEQAVNATLRESWRQGRRVYLYVYFLSAACVCLFLPATIQGVVSTARFGPAHAVGILIAVLACGVAYWSGERYARLDIRWDCHACGKRLTTDPWICGQCDQENWHYRYSFLNKCRECKAEPAGYVCPHCGEPTWFWKGADTRHPARSIPEPQPGETIEQARARREQELAEKRHEIERLKHEAEISSLIRQAERLRSPPAPPKDADTLMEEQLERALSRLKVGMRAVAKSKQLQAQVDQEIATNAPGLPAEEVERLREYARRQFDGYREDITLGRYDQ
jgi:hypothetical protein